MSDNPQPNIASRVMVERALAGEIPADALLDHIAKLEKRASVAGQFASWLPRFTR